MTVEAHHQDALIETARLELDRAHRAAIAMEAGEVRRGLLLALTALQSAAETDAGRFGPLASEVQTALADLDAGSLATMEQHVETVRKALAA